MAAAAADTPAKITALSNPGGTPRVYSLWERTHERGNAGRRTRRDVLVGGLVLLVLRGAARSPRPRIDLPRGGPLVRNSGVRGLLPEERRRELLPAVEMSRRLRRDEGRRAEPGLPDVTPGHPHAQAWRSRAARFPILLARRDG